MKFPQIKHTNEKLWIVWSRCQDFKRMQNDVFPANGTLCWTPHTHNTVLCYLSALVLIMSTAYMKLTEEQKSQLKGTSSPSNMPEYMMMMPAVSSKPLTPRGSPNNSRPSTPRTPRTSPSTSPCPRFSRSPSPSLRSPSPGSMMGGRRSPSLRSTSHGTVRRHILH